VVSVVGLASATLLADLANDGLVQAALGRKLATLVVYFLQQRLAGRIDKTDAAEVHTHSLGRRTSAGIAPALLESADPWPRQPTLDGQYQLASFSLCRNSEHADLRSEPELMHLGYHRMQILVHMKTTDYKLLRCILDVK
jgi:hypothetical protein